MMKYQFIYAIVFIAVFLYGCEDKITLENDLEKSSIVVDAWLKNDGSEQTINLYYSQDYYDSSPYKKLDDAKVTVSNADNEFSFESVGDGAYKLSGGQKIGAVGDIINLNIEFSDKTISAATKINRVPTADSIVIIEEKSQLGIEEGLYAELFATDFEGVGDTYMIRTRKNDTLLNRAREIVLIYDATFDAGSGLDGREFIRPLRLGINELDDDGGVLPYDKGDKIYVELMSISNKAFDFMQTVVEQATNGDNGIFALPVANALSNLKSSDQDELVLGFFNVAEVSAIDKEVE